MIATVDVETKGLDCTQYITGCLILERNNKPEIYNNKEKLWERILELGEKEQKRGKTLSVYAHNARYDFYAYANLNDKNIRIYSERPFIVSYLIDGKEAIKFLDTMSLYPMSLKEVGKLVDHHKQETPTELIQGTKDINLQQITPYMIRDTEICLKAVQHMKNRLKTEQIPIKRLITINQIAIQYLITQLKRLKFNTEYQEEYINKKGQNIVLKKNHIFDNKEKGITHKTKYANQIHNAYRGGRVECFKTGTIQNVTYIDCNSLYPYASTLIKFPNLKTEQKTVYPLYNTKLKTLLNKIGISKALITNNTNKIGILPIRTNIGNYYPKQGKTLIGVWTHQELKKAQKNGYTIHDIEWSITYQEAENPFKTITPPLYQRKQTSTGYDKYFYKSMMNCSYGKLAQRKQTQEIIIDSVEKAQEYLQQKYKIIKGLDYNYMYQKEKQGHKIKPYYTPIIPTLINAQSRLIMYEQYTKIPKQDLIYTDTDSIIFTGNHLNKFNITNKLGDYKIEHQNTNITIYGRKTYCIGQEIKVAGTRKKNITPTQFKTGKISNLKMQTLKT